MGKVFVIYYSMYGHVAKLAKEVMKGLEISGVKAELYQVRYEQLEKSHQKLLFMTYFICFCTITSLPFYSILVPILFG